MGDETTTVVTTSEIKDAEEASEATEAAAEATEAAAEAVEAAAQAAEAAADTVDTGPNGATDREVEAAERLAVLERDHTAHSEDYDRHVSREEMQGIARSVLWEEAESLAQYAVDVAAQEAAIAAGSDETTVVTDVPDTETKREGGFFRSIM